MHHSLVVMWQTLHNIIFGSLIKYMPYTLIIQVPRSVTVFATMGILFRAVPSHVLYLHDIMYTCDLVIIIQRLSAWYLYSVCKKSCTVYLLQSCMATKVEYIIFTVLPNFIPIRFETTYYLGFCNEVASTRTITTRSVPDQKLNFSKITNLFLCHKTSRLGLLYHTSN